MIGLDAGALLLQWAAGLLVAGWLTTRHRLVRRGYGYLVRLLALTLFAGALLLSNSSESSLPWVLPFGALVFLVATFTAGVFRSRFRDFDPEPSWDLLIGVVALSGLLIHVAGTHEPVGLALLRTAIGAAFLGVLTASLMLGHWYLIQPGLTRAPLLELVWVVLIIWPVELLLQLWPTGMTAVIVGDIDDGSGGLLGWFWLGCVVLTLALVIATRLALRETQYEAVMAATGLLYLAVLTGFGMDLVSRALLVPT